MLPHDGRANTLLPASTAGTVLDVPIESGVVAARVRVQLDGEELVGPFRVDGGALQIVLPGDLVPGRHDLVVWRDGVVGQGESERFLFDVVGNSLGGSAILSLEAGVRSAVGGDSERFAFGTLGVDLTSDDRRTRLAFRISRPDGGTSTGDVYELNSFELETTRAILGRDVTLKFGDHNLPEVDLQTDSGTRRGLSVSVAGASEDNRATVFALRPTEPDGENESGLEDSDDLIFGLRTDNRFGPGGAIALNTLIYDGDVAMLPSGDPGSSRLASIRVSTLAFDDRAEFYLGVGVAEWDDGTGPNDGVAALAGLTFGVLSEEVPDSLTFGLEVREIEPTYFTALDPGLIRDETGVTVTADYISAFWQVSSELDLAETNVDELDSVPTDRLLTWSLDVRYDPNDFTGTWLNGTTFFLNAEVTAVDRLETPAAGPDPEDNTFRRLSFGADRFRANSSWTVSYSIEELKDRTGSGAREWAQFVDGVWSLQFANGGSVAAGISLGDVHTAAGERFGETDVSLAYLHIFDNTDWTLALGAGFTDFEDPSRQDGSYARAELTWEFLDETWLVMAADYGKGSEELDLVGKEGWQLGLFVRSDIDLLRAF